jgi:hypothetical protein
LTDEQKKKAMQLKRSYFFKEKTHIVLTWQAKAVVFVIVLLIFRLCWPLVRISVTNYIYYVDELRPDSRIILENWDGNVDLFSGAKIVAGSLGATDIISIIYEDSYQDYRKRHAYILNAWAVGIDTTHLTLIPVPKRDPKTLNIARTVLDTANQRHWSELTIVTVDLHSARSRKAYQLAAKPYRISIQLAGIPIEEVSHTNWHTTSSGLAMAFSELIKKLYYDLVVF